MELLSDHRDGIMLTNSLNLLTTKNNKTDHTSSDIFRAHPHLTACIIQLLRAAVHNSENR